MAKMIKARIPFFGLLLYVLSIGQASAEKVVVVPLLGGDFAQWALLDSNHDIIEQSGGISVAKKGKSVVWLNFGKRVVGRPIIVSPLYTIGFSFVKTIICGDSASSADIDCGEELNDGNHVFVVTVDSTEAEVKRPFYIVIP